MKKLYYIGLVFCTIIISCKNTTTQQNSKPYVLTTTGMLADAVKNIAGDKVRVEALMGPGVDPHLYKTSQGDLQKLNAADIIIYNGLHLEGKMVDVLHKLGDKKPTIGVGDSLSTDLLLSINSGTLHDPHIWFDVKIWQQVAKNITSVLQENDTANAAYYAANYESYNQQLAELDAWVLTTIAEIPDSQRLMITAHDAFEYFGRAYNIEVNALQGISTMSDFGLQDVKALVDLIVARNIKAVFVESSVSARSITAVVEGCKQRGHNVIIGGTLYSDAMGEDGTPEGTYIGMVKHNVNTITNALK